MCVLYASDLPEAKYELYRLGWLTVPEIVIFGSFFWTPQNDIKVNANALLESLVNENKILSWGHLPFLS